VIQKLTSMRWGRWKVARDKSSQDLRNRRKLVYVVTEDWFFLTHFVPVARLARDIGFEVIVVTRVNEHGAAIESEGFRLISLNSERKAVGLLQLIRYTAQLCTIFRAERPAIVHALALKPLIFGGLAVRLTGVPAVVFSPLGLGYLWTRSGLVHRAARVVVRLIVRWLARGPNTAFVFENADDCAELGFSTKPGQKSVVVGGWGIEPNALMPTLPPERGPIRLAYLGRMLKAKGIAEAVDAVQRVRAQGLAVELDLWGIPDPDNFSSYTIGEIRALASVEGVTWHGWAPDIADVWRHAHIAILLSKREGLPRSVVEALACGRPVITTDVPGCRSVIRDGIQGILVPDGDHQAASAAITLLACNSELRMRMGAAARLAFEARFTTDKVVGRITEVYLMLTKQAFGEGSIIGFSLGEIPGI
jgi:glycosyltransferase involved in cell wall biosynthesis